MKAKTGSKSSVMAAVLVLLGLAFSVEAQQKPVPEKTARPEGEVAAGLKGKIFEVRFREPQEVYATVTLLGSGARGAAISYTQETRTITVRDYPENIALIGEAIKRLDVPRSERPADRDIELRIKVLIASNDPIANPSLPTELDEIVGQLRGRLDYRHYSLLTSTVQRTRNNAMLQGAGSLTLRTGADSAGNLNYRVITERVVMETDGSDSRSILLRNFTFEIEGVQRMADQLGNGRISSTFSLHDGEIVIAGSGALRGDKGIVVIVSASTK